MVFYSKYIALCRYINYIFAYYYKLKEKYSTYDKT